MYIHVHVFTLSSCTCIKQHVSAPDTSIVNRTPVANGSLEDWVKHELQDKPNGLWARVIVSQYKKDYHKDPPHNLLETVCSMPFIKAEE